MYENTNNFITLFSYPRAIVHIDCDAFFTSCEESREPQLKGRPIITGKERGIVACANYIAKARGVQRGVSLRDAVKACPDLVVLPSDYELYSIYSERMFSIIRDFTPVVEEYSIDEAFCDLTGLRRLYRCSYNEIAKKIKKAIQKELDITVSVGVSLSKTLAKICSKHSKPDGFTAVPGHKLHIFLRDVPLERVCGFGPNTVALLEKHGLKAVIDFVRRSRAFAGSLLGKIGVELWQELRGIPVYGISDEKKEKYLTISKTKTFVPASSNKAYVRGQLIRNMESAFIKLRRHKLSAGNIALYLRTSDYKGYALEARLNRHSSSTLDFVGIVSVVFDNLYVKGVMYRATGIVLSDIVNEGFDSRTLFDDPVRIERLVRASRAIDEINRLFGKHTVHIASSNVIGRTKAKHPRSNLTWRKQDLLKGETFRKRLNLPLFKIKV